MAVLGNITLSGPDAAHFSITGGTCSPSNGPVHFGAQCTITVAFNPTTVGPKAALLNVPVNPPACAPPGCISGRSVGLTGTGTGTLPGAAPASLTVAQDTMGTIDLAPFISGTGILGINIVAAPGNGVASVNGTRVTYTPNSGYLGPDAFSYVSFSATTTSPPAVVSVTVGARLNPAADPIVVGMLGAQAQTARRFSRAQIFNIQRRMETLHGGEPAAGAAGSLAGSRRPEAENIPVAAAGQGLLPAQFASTLLGASTTRTLTVSQSTTRAGESSGSSGGIGFWIEGSLRFGTRDETSNTSRQRFGTEGISVGVDRRFSERLALGIGLGYARDTTDIGVDSSKSRASGSSISLYGSYRPTQRAFVDGLIGYGKLKFDTDRFVAAANDFARAHRKGDQWFGSIAAGYELRGEGVLLSPYGRVDILQDRLKQATETGAGLNALTYFEQKLRTLDLSVGLRAESQHETNLGWALPRLRLEFRHDFEDDRAATLAYADQFAGPIYSVSPAGSRRNALLVGIGSDFVFRSGLKLGIDYQIQRLSGPDRSQAVRLWLSQELDGKARLPSGLSSAKLLANAVNVEVAYAADDNINRTRDAAEKLSDHIYSINVGQGLIVPLTDNSRIVLGGFVNGDKFRTYRGLDRFSAGGQGEYQYRASGDFGTPTFGVFGRVLFDDYHSRLRSGYRASLGVTYRQLLTDRISVFGALAGNERSARHGVFDGRYVSARFNLDYSLGPSGTLYLGGEYRRGDTVSTGGLSVQNAVIAKQTVDDDAFGFGQRIAYRYKAETTLWTLGYNWPLGPRDSIDLSWRHAISSPTSSGTFVAPGGPYGPAGTLVTVGKSRYTANQVGAAYLMRF